jgi:hypothetical protein
MHWLTRLSRIVALASLPMFSFACADRPPSTITVALTSEAPLPDGVRSVSIQVKRGGVVHLDQKYFASEAEVRKDPSIDPSKARYIKDIPGTLALVDDEKSSGAVAVRIEAEVVTDNGVVRRAVRSASAFFVAERQKLLRMPIQLSCSDVACNEGETCRAGRCLSEEVTEADLEDFAEEKVVPVDGRCFQREDCVGGEAEEIRLPIELVVQELDEQCTLPFLFPGVHPSDAGFAGVEDASSEAVQRVRASINMGYLWSGSYNIGNVGKTYKDADWTVVDQDPIEGWAYADEFDATRTLPGADLRAVLTEGLCRAIKEDRKTIEEAKLTGKPYRTNLLGTVERRGCAPKSRQVPECRSNQPGLGAAQKK